MRIKTLDLLAFGPFTNKTLDLSKGNPGLHVVHGENEAGKSSTLRALKSFLFGIAARSSDNFVHDYSKMRVGGTLELSGGEVRALVRRKGNKNTLLDAVSGDPVDDDSLQRLLPGMDEELFSRFHGIDHDELIKGGRAVLQASGDLGKALFGATGAGGNKDLLEQLGREAEALFKPRGANQVVNDLVARLKTTRMTEKDARTSVGEYKKLHKELKTADAAVADLETILDRLAGQKSKLERFQRVAGMLEDRRRLLERRDALGEVIELSENFGEQRREALERRARAQEKRKAAQVKLATRRAEVEALDVPREILDNQTTIDELYLHYGAVKKHDEDIARQDGQRRSHRNAAKELLALIRTDLTLDDVEQLRPLLNRRKTLANLAGTSKLLSQRLADIRTDLRDLDEEQAALEAELETISGTGRDVVPLKAAVAAARKAGDLEGRLREAREKVNEEEKACERELGRLGRFRGALAELAVVALPGAATLAKFDRDFKALEERARDRDRKRDEGEAELGKDEEQLAALLGSHAVPSLEDLEQVREHRDSGWRLVRRCYMDCEDPGEEATRFAGEQDLPDAYEGAVKAADRTADRLREAAERVERRASLEARIANTRKSLDALAAQEAEHAEAVGRVKRDWEGAWAGVTEEVGTPREMQEWRQKTETLLHRYESLETAQAEAEKLAADRQAHLDSVTAQLAGLQDGLQVDGLGLEELVTRGEQLVETTEAAARRRSEIEGELGKLEVKRKRAADEQKQAREEQEHWKKDWATAVDGMGLGSAPLTEQATETMERLSELFEKLKDAEVAHRRIQGMEQEGERFNGAVRNFAQRVGLELGEQKPGPFVLQLVDRLGKARADAATREKLESNIRELEEEIADGGHETEAAGERLTALQVQAQVEREEDLEPAWKRYEEKRGLTARIGDLEQRLRQTGDGLRIDVLEAEAAELDPDQVGGELARLDSELGDLRAKRDARRDERRTVLDRIAESDGSSKAAEAAEEAEQLLAELVPEVEQYLRLEIARLILEKQMEDYRSENQSPVLKRAGELFARLTLGSFSGLRDDLDDTGKPVLLGVRATDEEVTVEGMSDGTRDQLFLALRLATLELQIEKTGEPLPLVVDDILVGFDDPRSESCLEVLAELSRKTQVLLFTHHRAVAEMARELGERVGVFVHDLGQAGQSESEQD